MGHARTNLLARASSAGNPITRAVTLPAGQTVLALLLKGVVTRAGGAPTLSGGDPVTGAVTFVQANSTQQAATSPEASAELWYAVPTQPGPNAFNAGSFTLTIPNTGAITVFSTLESGSMDGGGGRSVFDGANGANNTAANPSPGAVTVVSDDEIAWAITAGGWTTWAPSAQTGTAIANTDDGAHGGGEQYVIAPAIGSHTLGWTFATSDDWGAVAAYFRGVGAATANNFLGLRSGDGVSCGAARVRP